MSQLTNIPLAYRLFFLYIEPISALVGAFYAGWQPAQYLAYLTTSPAAPNANPGPDTPTLISLQQLANLYVLFALNEHFVLSSTVSVRTWRTLLAGLLVADLGHLLTMVPLAWEREAGFWEVFGRFWAWDAMLWGSVGFVYAGAAMRTAFLLEVGIRDDQVGEDKKET